MAHTNKRRLQSNLRLRKPIVLLAVGVLVPVLLSTSVGIVAIALGRGSKDLVLGVLMVGFAAAAVGSAVALTVLLGLRARRARLQSDLLGNVSHELKTPLAAIRLHAQTLQSGAVAANPEMTKQCVDTIARETEWLDTMIERLLTWRAAAKDRFALHMETRSLAEAVEEAAARFERMLPPGEVTFEVRIDTQRPVRHDPHALTSVVLNLLTNAYKYTGPDKRIALVAADEAGGVVISVRDNGPGIPEAEQKRIFEPFHRVEAKRGGTSSAGLGLAIVDHLVRAHGGVVGVESAPGGGSVFTVRLPAAGEGNA